MDEIIELDIKNFEKCNNIWNDVVVHSDYQKKGIGKLLIESIVKDIEDHTKVGQKCSINLISMKGKETFYEKCGFRTIPFDYTGYGMTLRIEK